MSGTGSGPFSRVKFIQLGPPIDLAPGSSLPPLPPVEAGSGPALPPPGARSRPSRQVRNNGRQRALLVQREQEAYRAALIRIRERGLPMKLTRVDLAPDGSRLLFYFTSEGRIDFRDLVRELATEFRIRIEMRQIGVRDEARLLGGYGSCGRPLCCASWLQGFEPVSIKMAKQQDLSLNPWKLSGLCGRLKCCLRFELSDTKGCRKRPCAAGADVASGEGRRGDDDCA